MLCTLDPEKLTEEFDAEAVVLGKTVILPTMFEACTLYVRTSPDEQSNARARGIICINALIDYVDTIPQPQPVPFRGGMGVVVVETVDLDGK